MRVSKYPIEVKDANGDGVLSCPVCKTPISIPFEEIFCPKRFYQCKNCKTDILFKK